MTATVHVFAYGSNMCLERIRARVPSAEPLVVGYVPQRKIEFHKRSEDGSAKADAFFTGHDADRIWGVVYRLPAVEKPILDRCESLGVGYDQEEVDVILETGAMRAWTYIALDAMIDPSLQPYSWYHDFVIGGAQQHDLPDAYIGFLRLFDSMDDPDLERQQQNRRLIESIGAGSIQ